MQVEGTNQSNLIISSENEPIITVDDIEVAQFAYLILNHKKLRNAINAITERGVLILGCFKEGGIEVLQEVAAKLRKMGYIPILYDFVRPVSRNNTETIKALVSLSRFVIVDLSGPSVPQELQAIVTVVKIPFVPIIERGRRPWSMHEDILEYPWVFNPPLELASTNELIDLLPSRVVAPAEEKCKERQALFDRLFR